MPSTRSRAATPEISLSRLSRLLRALALCSLALGALPACDGVLGDGPAGPIGSPDGPDPRAPTDVRIETRVWRLSPMQFDDEVARLLGPGAPDVVIPASAGEDGLTNIAANARVDLGNASIYVDGTRSIGTWAAAQGGAVSRCTDHGTDACIDSFLAWFPESAYRRPVSAEEIAELRSLFDDLRAAYDYDYAFSGLVRAVLLSPEFLYRTELGDDADVGTTTLTGGEISNLLAFAITDESPDDELRTLARSGGLEDPDVREAQARRLMSRSERMWQRFFWEWLHMATLDSQGAEVGLEPAMIEQMEEEYRSFVREIVVVERGTLRSLLSAPYTWTQPELAALYGAEHSGTGLARVELDPLQRGGLLTQGAWLVSHGKRGRDNVVRRGMNIFVDAMCNNITVPADLDVDAELARLVGADATVREVVEARGTTGTCAGCHHLADPVGLVFESYASTGAWQTVYPDGNAVDTAIELEGLGSFDEAPSFSVALADDHRFQHCFVRRLTHFMSGIDLGAPARVDWTLDAHTRFVESDTSLEELLVAIVRHPAFIERRK
ncbi:MAG: DUF1592 domain-containing protein [Myxococcota bacterium]|nr:DUF1592 domain-containing protein [Myxococcota bacterium]